MRLSLTVRAGTSPGRLMRHSPFPHPASEHPLERNSATSAPPSAPARRQTDAGPSRSKRSSRFRRRTPIRPKCARLTRPRPCRPATRTGWFDRWLAACQDLAELERSHPMTDAVIDEIDGRMIRIGEHWLADFASCNYLGFDLDREIIASIPEYIDALGHSPELVAAARQPRPLRADRGAADGAARLRGLARPADDHAHPLVGDPGAGPRGDRVHRQPGAQDDLGRLPARRRTRRHAAAVPASATRRIWSA